MKKLCKNRADCHDALDVILDMIEVSYERDNPAAFAAMWCVLSGIRYSNSDNSAYDDYERAICTLADVGFSWANGQGAYQPEGEDNV